MPRRRSQSTQRALVLGTLAVLVGLAALVGLAVAAGRGDVDISNLGDRDFKVGDTDRLARRIAQDRRPFLFPDPSPNKKRLIYVDHAGGPLTRGWVAILAGTPACPLEWNGSGYRDTCTDATYPRDGTGLTQYRTYVDGDTLYVDLRTVVK